jgi:DNA replication protein DnaD
VDLLLLANHSENSFRVRGNLVFVSRGEVARSEDSLAQRWKWSRNKVRRFIAELSEKTAQQIEQQKSPILSKIRIINYNLYQSNDKDDTTDDTTERQQKDTNKNDKNDKNDKEVKKDTTQSVCFLEFWTAYPKKVSKPQAERAFQKAIKKTDLGKILESVNSFKNSEDWTKEDGKYIPNPATWLNGERWNDNQQQATPTYKQYKPKPLDFE